MDKDRKQKEEMFLQAISEGKNQKQACAIVGWDKSVGSKFLKKIRETEPDRLPIQTTQNPHTEDLGEKWENVQETAENGLERHTETHRGISETAHGGNATIAGQREKPEKKFLKFNITEYEDYLKAMAWYNKTSVTGYIQGLITADMERNREKYEKLKEI